MTAVRGARATGVLTVVALGVAVALTLPAAAVAVGIVVPGSGRLGRWAPVLLPVYGPGLVVVSLAATLLAWAMRRRADRVRRVRRVRRAATVVTAGCGLATVALAAVLAILLTAVLQAGGSVSPLRALVPGAVAPAGAPADLRPEYAVSPTGRPLHLAVWRPAPDPRGAPVFVYVHGGGWIGGSELGRAAELRGLADRGWLAVSVEYTLAGPGRPTWDVDGPEVACALARTAGTATALGGDPSRIVLAGDSAGGQLAISVGYHAASGTQASSCGGAVPVPRAIATEYPAADLVDGYEHGATGGSPALDARVLAATYTGGTPAQVPDRYRAVSGAAAITPAAPPTLVVAPARDSLVPPAGLARFVRTARDAGVDATLVPVPFTDHAFDQLAAGSLGQQAGLSILERWSATHAAAPPRDAG